MSNKKTKINLKQIATNLFGYLGYFFCSMQWFWVVSLYFGLLKSLAISTLPTASNDSPAAQPIIRNPDVVATVSSAPNVLLVFLSIIITVIVVVLTVYVLLKMPSTITKVSKNVVRGAAEGVAPIILQIQHKKDTKKNQIKLTPLLVLIMKVILIVAPVGLTFASQLLPEQLVSFNIAICISFLLFCISLFNFSIQYIFSRVFLIKVQDIK